jgi:iron complex outermembrane receptor protein
LFGRTALALCLLFSLAVAAPAHAESYPTPIRVSAGPLDHALKEIARQTGGELLFDRNLVAGLQARTINTKTTAMAAIQAALAGTNLRVRRTVSGALIIEPPAPTPLARQDVAVAEVLVIGHRTQNADIRRQETDIQPYRVTTVEEINEAHVDDLGQYFATHITMNANFVLAGQGEAGDTNSQIDLRGLGTDQTLILIDGRRMPNFPQNLVGVTQPDLNALSLHAIDRIETLTGTAGGIYGFGALGGVVNVVLAHDRPGAELHVTTGLSSRGDAGRVSFEGRVEFSPDHGATEVTLDAGLTRSDPLTQGQRDYLARDRRVTYQVDPSDSLSLTPSSGNSIGVFDAFGDETLTLKPKYGGAALGSPFTFLPSGFEGTPQDLAAALVSRAGKLDLGLSTGEAASYIGANPETGSLLMNVRHQFSGGVEAYFDGIMLWNHGRTVNHNATTGLQFLDPSSPYNPFEQDIFVSYPMPPSSNDIQTRYDSSRFTVGLVAPIPFDWRATAEATWGGAQFQQSVTRYYDDPFATDDANPFGSWTQFQKVLAASPVNGSYRAKADSRYLEQSLRLGGGGVQDDRGGRHAHRVGRTSKRGCPWLYSIWHGRFGIVCGVDRAMVHHHHIRIRRAQGSHIRGQGPVALPQGAGGATRGPRR